MKGEAKPTGQEYDSPVYCPFANDGQCPADCPDNAHRACVNGEGEEPKMNAINLPQRAWFLVHHPHPEHPKWQAAVLRLLRDVASVLDDDALWAQAYPQFTYAPVGVSTSDPPPDPDVLPPHVWAMGEPQPGTLVELHEVWRAHPEPDPPGQIGNVLAGPFPDGEVLVRWHGNPDPYTEAVPRERLWEVTR